MLEKMLNRLPDAYNKTEQSNIYKIIKLAADQLAKGERTLQLIQDWRDIDQAEGKTLDKLGKDVGQPREGYNDDDYRKRIKIKIRSNLSGGEIETLNSIAVVLLSDRFQGIQEGWTFPTTHPIGSTPAMMLFTVKADGINYGIPMAEIDEISAGGVAANWELLFENAVDIAQTDFEHWSAPYKLTNEFNSVTEQQQGPVVVGGVEAASRYHTATHRLRMSGAEQQPTAFYYPQIEATTQFIKGLHNFQMAGMAKVGEGVIL